jgi:hypothetical protein
MTMTTDPPRQEDQPTRSPRPRTRPLPGEPDHMGESDDAGHPRDPGDAGDGARAALTETPAGWVLTLTLDARAARAFQAGAVGAGRFLLEPTNLTVSITPNLVPGEPFTLQAIELVVAEDEPTA